VRSPQHSQELGISTVYQEINLCTNISVAENIMLGHEPRRFGSINWKKMNDLASQAMQRLGVDVDVTRPLENYSVAIQQMVAIARALNFLSAKVLILDEPTSSLDIQETNLLFDVMRKLKSEAGIVFITHFLIRCIRSPTGSQCLAGKLVGTFDIFAAHRTHR
jgi:simple sugar transport system ATP-binding protein